MLILGIDPGTATTGFGLIEILNKKVKVREWGLIETKKDVNVAQRLNSIYQKTLSLIKNNKPDIFAIEKIFFATNAKTAIAVGQAQGVMLLASAKLNVPVVEYAPGTIKKVVSGNGRAKKKEVQRSLRKVFGNHVKSKAHKKTHFDNAADALAIALTHARLITQGR